MKYLTKQLTKNARGTKNSQAGFTLVELIMTMAIAAIILTQAIPSFSTTIRNSHLTTETNKLVADMNLARSEAIKRGVNVMICATQNPSEFVSSVHDPDCDAASDWNTGWIVFADDDDDGSFAAANDTLLRIGHGQASNSSVGFSTATASFGFTSDGLSTGGATTIIICDDRGTSKGREIVINTTGRPSLDTTITSCT